MHQNQSISTVRESDLTAIRALQPDGWPDIVLQFKYYIERDFCFPFKVKSGKYIVGVGSYILFGNSAWLAHIIVHPQYRSHGIGRRIIDHLLNDLPSSHNHSVMLIATELGEPLYKKVGFEISGEYMGYERMEPLTAHMFEIHGLQYLKQEDHSKVCELDRQITGEDRQNLLQEFLNRGIVAKAGEGIMGFYLPGLGEGPIIAKTPEAGINLMKKKYLLENKAVLPTENEIGREWLMNHGFISVRRLKRMHLGVQVYFQPTGVFSRIGGNFG